MEKGQIDADLGGGVIKQRIARKGQGKSSGYRSIILLHTGHSAIFVFGFAKKDMDNIHPHVLRSYKVAAADVRKYTGSQIEQLVKKGFLAEIKR